MSRETPPPPDALRYWRVNLYVVGTLLPIWFILSFGLSIVWADRLNEFHLGGFPLGFWISQQGSIFVFVILILAYAIVMGRLDRKFRAKERQ